MTDHTRTSIINLALREIGTDRIEIDTESTPEADVARDVWDQAVRHALGRHEWQFAMKGRGLALSASVPEVRYTKVFTLPGDFVRLGSVSEYATMEPPLLDFVMRTDGIHCSKASCYIEYVYYVDDTDPAIGTWPAWFVNVLAADLASLMASPLKSTTERERLEQLALDRLRTGRTIQSQQGAPQRWREGSWVTAHRGGRVR